MDLQAVDLIASLQEFFRLMKNEVNGTNYLTETELLFLIRIYIPFTYRLDVLWYNQVNINRNTFGKPTYQTVSPNLALTHLLE